MACRQIDSLVEARPLKRTHESWEALNEYIVLYRELTGAKNIRVRETETVRRRYDGKQTPRPPARFTLGLRRYVCKYGDGHCPFRFTVKLRCRTSPDGDLVWDIVVDHVVLWHNHVLPVRHSSSYNIDNRMTKIERNFAKLKACISEMETLTDDEGSDVEAPKRKKPKKTAEPSPTTTSSAACQTDPPLRAQTTSTECQTDHPPSTLRSAKTTGFLDVVELSTQLMDQNISFQELKKRVDKIPMLTIQPCQVRYFGEQPLTEFAVVPFALTSDSIELAMQQFATQKRAITIAISDDDEDEEERDIKRDECVFIESLGVVSRQQLGAMSLLLKIISACERITATVEWIYSMTRGPLANRFEFDHPFKSTLVDNLHIDNISMSTLLPDSWLNDTIFEALRIYWKDKRGYNLELHVVPSFSYTEMEVRFSQAFIQRLYTVKAFADEETVWCFPINWNNSHWTAIIVCAEDEQIFFYDSYKTKEDNEALRVLAEQLQEEVFEDFSVAPRITSPTQTGSCSCGVFVANVMWNKLDPKVRIINQRNVNSFRFTLLEAVASLV